MGLSPNAGLGALNPADGLEAEDWAENEFGGAPLGDARLGQRLISVAAAKACPLCTSHVTESLHMGQTKARRAANGGSIGKHRNEGMARVQGLPLGGPCA